MSDSIHICVCLFECVCVRIRHKSRCFCAKNWPMEIFISFVKALKETAVMIMGAYLSIILKTFLCIYVLLNKNVESEKTTVSCHTLFSTRFMCTGWRHSALWNPDRRTTHNTYNLGSAEWSCTCRGAREIHPTHRQFHREKNRAMWFDFIDPKFTLLPQTNISNQYQLHISRT